MEIHRSGRLRSTYGVGQVPQRAVDMLNRGWATAYALLRNYWSAINLISGQTHASVSGGGSNSTTLRNFIEAEWKLLQTAIGTALTALGDANCSRAVGQNVIDTDLSGSGAPSAVLSDLRQRGRANFNRYEKGKPFSFFGSSRFPREEELVYRGNRGLERDTALTSYAASGRYEHPRGYTRFGDAFFDTNIAGGLQFPSGTATPANLVGSDNLTRALIVLHEVRVIIDPKGQNHDDSVYNSEIYDACFKNSK